MNKEIAEDPSHLYKICLLEIHHVLKNYVVLIGDAGVGKTFLLNKYIRKSAPKNPASTIGVEFATKTVELKVGGKVKAQIWDTAGQERYRAITSAHYRRALGALLVYDITNEKTFENLKKWIEEVRNLSETDITLMLVGNKVDRTEMRRVKKDDGRNFAKDYDLLFMETSAITGTGVNDCFEELLERIFEKKEMQKNKENKEREINVEQTKGQQLTYQNIQVQPNKNNNCC